MREAWAVRKGEQERFIEELIQKFWKKADELTDSIDEKSPEVLEQKIKEKRESFTRGFLLAMLGGNPLWFEGLTASFFQREILESIRGFSRTPEEAEVIKWRFILEVAERTFLQDSENTLRDLERKDPEKIFHASSAMTKV